MTSFKGRTNLSDPLIGRVYVIPSEEPYILLVGEVDKGKEDYCVICRNDSKPISAKHYFYVSSERLPELRSGDVVQLSPSGRGIVLHQVGAIGNALLLTNRCNNKCIMCSQPSHQDNGDELQTCLSVIRMIKTSEHDLCITGGEPTLVWDDLLKVLEEIRNRLPQAMTTILTNGRLLADRNRVKTLRRLTNGHLVVGVPLYSAVDILHDHVTGVDGSFWETFSALHNMASEEILVELRTVVLKQNVNSLSQWAAFITKNLPFCSHVAIMAIEPVGIARKNIDKLWVDPRDAGPSLRAAVQVLNRAGIPVSLYNFQLCTIRKELWRFAVRSISSWKNIYPIECSGCLVRSECCGLFQGALRSKRPTLSAIVKSDKKNEEGI